MDITALLTGGGIDQAYQAQDPFYQAGRGIGQIQMGAPRNNTEAFLLPFLQGSLAYGLTGYGKTSATNTAYQDISKMLGGTSYTPTSAISQLNDAGETVDVPLQYGLPEAPEGFSSKIGLQDLLLANTAKEAKIEAAAKTQETIDRLRVEEAIKSTPSYYERIRKEKEMEALGEKAGKGAGSNIPAAIMGEIADQAGIVEEARALSSDLKASGKSWAGLQGAGMFAGLDSDATAARVADLADRVMRSRTGATAPPAEAATIKKFIAGDRTVGPQQMANLLAKFADREAVNAKAKIKVASSFDPSALFDAPTTETVKAPISAAQAQAELRRRGLIP